MTEPLRAAILSEADRASLQAVVPGRTLREAGEALVREGVTSADEIERLLG
jgi:type II secretory ATPase GspE/PulE/Tfp pilus assembly ATPase PilB-like protein